MSSPAATGPTDRDVRVDPLSDHREDRPAVLAAGKGGRDLSGGRRPAGRAAGVNAVAFHAGTISKVRLFADPGDSHGSVDVRFTQLQVRAVEIAGGEPKYQPPQPWGWWWWTGLGGLGVVAAGPGDAAGPQGPLAVVPHRRLMEANVLDIQTAVDRVRKTGLKPVTQDFLLSVVIPVYNERRWLPEVRPPGAGRADRRRKSSSSTIAAPTAPATCSATWTAGTTFASSTSRSTGQGGRPARGVQAGHRRRRHRPGRRPRIRSGRVSAAPPADPRRPGRRRLRLAVPRRAAPRALLLALGRQQDADDAVEHVHQPEPDRHGDLLQGLPPRGARGDRRCKSNRFGFEPEVTAKVARKRNAAVAGLRGADQLLRPDVRGRQEDPTPRTRSAPSGASSATGQPIDPPSEAFYLTPYFSASAIASLVARASGACRFIWPITSRNCLSGPAIALRKASSGASLWSSALPRT